MDNEKKLELLMEVDSTTDWQALINEKGATSSKSQDVQQKPGRKLSRAEKKQQKMKNQLEEVKKTIRKMKDVPTVVYKNPDSRLAKSARSKVSQPGEQAPEKSPTEEVGVELDMRKTRHEIIKFGMSSLKSKDLEDAEATLAISLGAKPTKKLAINYKELQAQRKKDKEMEMELEANFSKPTNLSKSARKTSKTGKGKIGNKSKPAGHGRSNNANARNRFSKSKSRPKKN